MQSFIFNKTDLLKNEDCVVTIGVFDGIHKGHQKVLSQTVELAKKLGVKAMAISFNINPKMADKRQDFQKPLLSPKQMEQILVNIGIDYHCVIDFYSEISKLSGVEFIAKLCSFCTVKAMLIGNDFRCGTPSNSLGATSIQEVLNQYSVDAPVVICDSVYDSNQVISSSLVRSMLLKGDVIGVIAKLGRPYALDVSDVVFNQKDKTLLTKADSLMQLLPKSGLYQALVLTKDGSERETFVSINGLDLSFWYSESVKIDQIYFLRSNHDDY